MQPGGSTKSMSLGGKAGQRLKGFEVVAQAQDYWCWAAVASAIADHYTRSKTPPDQSEVKQCDVVTSVLSEKSKGGWECQALLHHAIPAKDCCKVQCPKKDRGTGACDPKESLNWNKTAKVVCALLNVGHCTKNLSDPWAYKHSIVKEQIDKGRPLAGMISWDPGTGNHFVTIAGYGTSTVLIGDPYTYGNQAGVHWHSIPIPADDKATYGQKPKTRKYKYTSPNGTGYWTSTTFTQPRPAAPTA